MLEIVSLALSKISLTILFKLIILFVAKVLKERESPSHLIEFRFGRSNAFPEFFTQLVKYF